MQLIKYAGYIIKEEFPTLESETCKEEFLLLKVRQIKVQSYMEHIIILKDRYVINYSVLYTLLQIKSGHL